MPARDAPLPKRKHLRRLSRVTLRDEIYLVTVCAQGRRPVLTSGRIAPVILDALRRAVEQHDWLVGRYVIMPDHLHFFCGPTGRASDLSDFVGYAKGVSAALARKAGLTGRLWQREFFDHLLRSDESYEQKWHYVRNNPIRAGLCSEAQEWPYQGQLAVL